MNKRQSRIADFVPSVHCTATDWCCHLVNSIKHSEFYENGPIM